MFEVLICLLIINVKLFFLQYTNYVHKVLCNLIHRHLNIEQYFSKHIYQEPDARLRIRNRICALFELYMTNRFQILSIQLVCLALGFANVFGCIAFICKRDDLSLRFRLLLSYETCCYATLCRCRSHSTVAGHGLVRFVWDPRGGPSLVHSSRMWSAVCSGAPHRHAAEELRPQRYMLAAKRPTPVRRRLRVTHSLQGRSSPGGMVLPVGW